MWRIVLALWLAAGLLLAGCTAGGSQGLRIGGRAPDFRLSDLDGQSVALSGFLGEPVLVNFWATWCPPCRIEMPHLQAVFEEWSSDDLVLLSINTGEDASTVRQFMQDNGYTFPVLLDIDAGVSEKYHIRSIPASFFIDRDGVIRDAVIGAFTSKEAIERYLAKIMP